MGYTTYTQLYTPSRSTSTIDTTRFGLPTSFSSSSSSTSSSVYKSSDPKVWGPHLWKYMHCAAANYPENPSPKQVNDMVVWLQTLTTTIPCQQCQKHYGQYINSHVNTLHDICSSRDRLFNFIVDIHNQVNKRNNKPAISYDEAKRLYCTKKDE